MSGPEPPIPKIPSSTMDAIMRGWMRSMETSQTMKSDAMMAVNQYFFRYLIMKHDNPFTARRQRRHMAGAISFFRRTIMLSIRLHSWKMQTHPCYNYFH